MISEKYQETTLEEEVDCWYFSEGPIFGVPSCEGLIPSLAPQGCPVMSPGQDQSPLLLHLKILHKGALKGSSVFPFAASWLVRKVNDAGHWQKCKSFGPDQQSNAIATQWILARLGQKLSLWSRSIQVLSTELAGPAHIGGTARRNPSGPVTSSPPGIPEHLIERTQMVKNISVTHFFTCVLLSLHSPCSLCFR